MLYASKENLSLGTLPSMLDVGCVEFGDLGRERHRPHLLPGRYRRRTPLFPHGEKVRGKRVNFGLGDPCASKAEMKQEEVPCLWR